MREGKWDIKKWFRKDNLVILVLSGVLLFIIALPSKESASSGQNIVSKGQQRDGTLTEDGSKEASGSLGQTDGTSDYVEELEERLSGILSKMSGVGQVEVMITLSASEELVVEKDTPVNRSSTNENDSSGGSRVIAQTDGEEATVYRTNGSESEPYVIKTLYPKVEGVVVVAEGAGNGTVNKSIVDMVQVLFDLDAHKVKVVKMVSSNNVDK